MTKIICIQLPILYFGILSIGKIYDADEKEDCWMINMLISSYDPATKKFYWHNTQLAYSKDYFITLAQWREKQIDKILE